MNIYCVPPLLSAIVLFTLFLMGILKAKSKFALDTFVLRIPMRKSVKRTIALKRGGTQ